MAAKINKRFVFILLGVCAVVVVGVAGLAFLAIRADAGRNIRRGDANMAEGDYRSAVEQFGRAVFKEPNNMEYIDKLEGALLTYRPTSQFDAGEKWSERLGVLFARTRARQSEAEHWLALIDELRADGELSGDTSYWLAAADAAERATGLVSMDDPGLNRIRAIGLIARARTSTGLTDAEIRDLEEGDRDSESFAGFVEEVPGDTDLLAEWAAWKIRRSDGLFLEQSLVDAARLYSEAQELLSRASAIRPNSPDVVIVESDLLRSRVHRSRVDFEVESDLAAYDAELKAVGDRLTRAVKSDPQPRHIRIAGPAMISLGGDKGREALVELLEAHLQQNSEAIFEKWILADLEYRRGNYDRAQVLGEELLNGGPIGTSFMAKFRFDVNIRVARNNFHIEFRRRSERTGEDLAEQTNRARAARDRLASLVGAPVEEHPYVVECDAWLAWADKDHAKAAAKFSSFIEQRGSADPRTLWAAADALMNQNSPGMAEQYLRRALEQAKDSLSVLEKLARVELQLGRYEDAIATADRVLELDEDNSDAQLVRAQAQVSLGDPIDAMPAMEAIERATALADDGDHDGARSVLLQAHQEQPMSYLIVAQLTRLEVAHGWEAEAEARLAALSEQHRDPRLKSLLASVRGEDRIQILHQVMEDLYLDEDERLAMTWVNLRNMARSERVKADRLERTGETESASTAAEEAKRLDEAATQAQDRVTDVGRLQPEYLAERLTETLEQDDMAAAEAVVAQARESDADQANGLTYQARLAIHREDYAGAVAALDQASKLKPFSLWIWRTLGYSYEQIGNKRGAIVAFQKALLRQPNDVPTISQLSRLLAESGDVRSALELLRTEANKPGPASVLTEQWLILEGESGDAFVVIEARRERFEADSTDRANAIRLARLLGRTIPDHRSFLRNDDPDDPLYTERAWAAMLQTARDELVEPVRTTWKAEAEDIFSTLVEASGDDLELRLARTLYYRDSGQVARGRQLLQDFIDGSGASDPNTYVGFAQFLSSVGDRAGAIEVLKSGLSLQDDETRFIDRALSAAYQEDGQYENALAHLERVAQASNEASIALMTVQTLTQLRRFDEAEQKLLAYEGRPGQRSTYETELIRAHLKGGQGQEFLAQDKAAEAARAFKEQGIAIANAIALAPLQPKPYVMLAQSKLEEFKRGGRVRPALLNDANLQLTRALGAAPRSIDALKLRSEVLLLKTPPDIRGAISQFLAITEINPRDDEVRRLAIQLCERINDRAKAIELALAAVELNRRLPKWHRVVGNLYEGDGQFMMAAQAYDRALAISGLPGDRILWAASLLREPDPQVARAVRDMLLGEQADWAGRVLSLRSLLARAYALSEQWDEAVAEMRLAYTEHAAAAAREPGGRDWLQSWWMQAVAMYGRRDLLEFDDFVHSVTEGKLDLNQRYFLALEWIKRGVAGSARAIELLDVAYGETKEEDLGDRGLILGAQARARYALGEHSTASDLFLRALEYKPDDPALLNDLAYLYADAMGQAEMALPYAEKAAELVPENSTILDTLGTVYLRLDDLRNAERILLRSLAIEEGVDNNLHMGELMLKKNQAARARHYLEQALKLGPDAQLEAEIRRLLDDISP